MKTHKLFAVADQVTPANFEEVMQQAIALELATIPTYLSTYYSINRAQDQDALYDKIYKQLNNTSIDQEVPNEKLAEELKTDILVYANKAAALIMSVVVEEMLHLSLACNVKQAISSSPDLISIGKTLKFPAELVGHEPEFVINIGKLDLDQLSTFLQIESPDPFTDPADSPETANDVVKYKTIGRLYNMIIECVQEHYPGPYAPKPQLLPNEPGKPSRPFYSQNSVNTVYYDEKHKPVFGSADDSGDLVGVYDAASAIKAMNEIKHQGEGNDSDDHNKLEFDSNNMPIPLPVVNGKVQFKPGDYDDPAKEELSHYAKFLEVYSLGVHYKEKFGAIAGMDDFFSYFVADQLPNQKQATYDLGTGPNQEEIAWMSKLGNALYTYIILMVETCYYKDEHTQFQVFMYGIHKSMIWLLSDVGNAMRSYTFTANDGSSYTPSLTFEFYDFSEASGSPKEQLIEIAKSLANSNPSKNPDIDSVAAWSWLYNDQAYLPSLPDVGLDHSVKPNVPSIPA
ncbi:ferritin-like domain-containing protein [Roseivirga pacifica]|uniref:ferritin-like domain-containing protein n=1 Tax=Roseivirga pacifica TaxID=1267423 RepID=UPI003BB0D6FF